MPVGPAVSPPGTIRSEDGQSSFENFRCPTDANRGGACLQSFVPCGTKVGLPLGFWDWVFVLVRHSVFDDGGWSLWFGIWDLVHGNLLQIVCRNSTSSSTRPSPGEISQANSS